MTQHKTINKHLYVYEDKEGNYADISSHRAVSIKRSRQTLKDTGTGKTYVQTIRVKTEDDKVIQFNIFSKVKL
jgi:hypothetical protein